MKLKAQVLALLFCSILITSPLYATIRVGTLIFYPPFVISTDEGFDIDLMRAICTRLHETCQFQSMEYRALFPSLQAGKIDLAIGGISITLAHLQHFIFSLPYLVTKGQLLVLKSSNVKTIMDLIGKKVGVLKGQKEKAGVFYTYLDQNFKGKLQIVEFNNLGALITALANGDVTAVFMHKSGADYWEQNGGDQFQTLGHSIRVGEGLGIMALPTQAALIQRINEILQEMENDSTYLNIYKTYFN